MFALARENQTVVGVIDGAGGSENGRRASRIGSAVFAKAFREGIAMEQALKLADAAIREHAPKSYAAGVIIEIERDGERRAVTIGYTADCKAMTLRGNKKLSEGTTKFQNVAQAKVDLGLREPHEYYTDESINMITGGLGVPDPEHHDKPGVIGFAGQTGDIIVAGSDGFWDIVSEYEIEEFARACGASAKLEERLFALAYERNNSVEPFTIQHSEDVAVEKQLSKIKADGLHKRGDNITLAVVELNP